MKSEQPKALYLAANCDPEDAFEVACSKELRRLHEENTQLLIRIRKLEGHLYAAGAGGVSGELK